MKSPIAIIIFNRPDHAAKLRESLRAEEDRPLFVISDGARLGRADEDALVVECRRIFSDWPGEVHTNYTDQNMGCKARVSTGLDWVFEHTERAIILEDDCLPHPDFFQFCDELLERYADSEQVMSICGTKTFPEAPPSGDYVFSKYNNCWGWATWRRAWTLFDDDFSKYSTASLFHSLKKWLGSYRAAMYWIFILNRVLSGKIDSWAYCWSVTCFITNGLHIHPPSNLIVNAGFGAESTHTEKQLDYAPTRFGGSIAFPLTTSDTIQYSPTVDRWIEDTIFSKSLTNRLKWLFQRCLSFWRV